MNPFMKFHRTSIFPDIWEQILWSLGWVFLIGTHTLFLDQAPGFHYDEAWAALFSQRILKEPGFWPFQAMSPYASAWSHYVAAIFFKFLGSHLWVYRLSGTTLVVSGVWLLSKALRRLEEQTAAVILPWVVAFFPSLVMNHRFVIEITTFHVFCLGLLAWGIALQLSSSRVKILPLFFIGISLVLGVTSHILFVAPALGAVGCLALRGFYPSHSMRFLTSVVSCVLIGFFIHVFLLIPDQLKVATLLLVSFSVLVWSLLFQGRSVRVFRVVQVAFPFFLILLAIALVLVLFLAEGTWEASYFNGGQIDLRFIGWSTLVLLLSLGFAFSSIKTLSDLQKGVIQFMGLTLVSTALIAVKPTPRYFEIPFILLAVVFSKFLALLSFKRRFALLLLWIFLGSGHLFFNYFQPLLAKEWIPEKEVSFLFFHDGSSDVLQKQKLARALGDAGCRFDQIVSNDVRVYESLRFLALEDWKVSATGSCQSIAKLKVLRMSQYVLKNNSDDTTIMKQLGDLGPFIVVE